MMGRIAEASPRLKARIAGVSYLLAILTGVFAEFFVRGRLGFAAILIPASCNIAVTLLFCDIFKPVNRSLANYLSPYNLAAGILGQGSLTLRLLVMGVNVQRWKEQASAAGMRT